MTDTAEVDYATRKAMERAGVPFGQLWGDTGLYLAHWVTARQAGKKTSVAAACEAAGFSPDALRQRRRHHPTFAAAERWARRGEPYVHPVEPERIKAADDGPGKPLVVGAPRSAGFYEPPVIAGTGKKRPWPRRYGIPAWAAGDGYPHD